MPALSGQIIITLRNDVGDPIFTITENYNPSTFAMIDANVTTSSGVKNGAVVVDNQTGTAQRMAVVVGGVEQRSFNVPPSGARLTAAQLAGLTPAVTVIQDLNGITPVLA